MPTRTESFWTAPLVMSVASLIVACSADTNGQRGSPNHDSPPYEDPEPAAPNNGAGNSSGGPPGGYGYGFGRGPVILPPRPPASAAVVVDDLLLRAGPQGLTLLDLSKPAAPEIAGRVALGPTAIVAAPSRDRIALTVTQKARSTGDQIPAAPLPDLEQYLKLFDVTDPRTPLERASALLPFGTRAVVPLPAGYAVLGARFNEAVCYGLDGVVASQPDLPRPLFIERYVERDGGLVREARQDYDMGVFELSSDGEHAVRFATDARGVYASEVEVEVIDLTTFESKTPLSIPRPPAGASISADVAGGLLMLAAGSNVWVVDLSSGDVSAPLGTDGRSDNVRFVVPGELGALLASGQDAQPNGYVRLGPAGAKLALSLVPLPDAGTPFTIVTGALTPFGDGFLQLGASGGTSSVDARVLAKRYTFDDAGLAFRDEAQTDWPFICSGCFGVDARNERVAYSMGPGSVGLLARVAGTFGASSLSALGASVDHGGSFLFDHETLFVNHARSVEPVAIDLAGTRPALRVAPEVFTEPADVLDRLDRGGLVFTLESQDFGEPSFGYRRAESSARVALELPHAAETMFAIDATHVAALGLGHSGDCERLDELGTPIPGCGVYPHNGVSVFAIHDDSVELVRSVPLISQALLQPAPEGVEQTLDWSGFFEVGGRFELLGIWKRHCTSEAACRAISTVAYQSTGGSAPSSMCTANCGPTETKTWDGYRNESVLLALDFSNPDDPGLGTLVLGGKAQDIIMPPRYDVGPHLLRYQATDGEHLAYVSLEPVYDSKGSQVSDSHDHPLGRHYVTLLESAAGHLAFGDAVNVPGTPIALFGPELTRKQTGQVLLTLESSYPPTGGPYQTLDRLRIEAGLAYVEERLDVGPFVSARSVWPGLVALLAGPPDACSEDASYELRVADARGQTLALSAPVVLPLSGERWEHAGHGYSLGSELSALAPQGQVYVYGGPATNGRLVLDITYNPPKVVRYETLE